MRVLFASDYPHLPENTGGVEVNTHELCLALRAAGHQVAVLAALCGRGAIGALARVKLRCFRVNFAVDCGLGYAVMRSWQPSKALRAAMAKFCPDVVVVQSWRFDMVAEALGRGTPAMLYSHSAQSIIENVDCSLLNRCVLAANSTFNADFQGRAIGAKFNVLQPLINGHRYLCDGPRNHVVQVGLSPGKGTAVTVAVAQQRPDISFLIVQNWEGLRRCPEIDGLFQKAVSLPNVRIIPPKRDARELYRQARLLLAPSQAPETWGRVVSEAQVNGIPVVASNVGGLPEAVGSGGILLDCHAPVEVWAREVGRLWDDADWYAEMARRSRERAALDDIRPELLLNRFVRLLQIATRLYAPTTFTA